MNELTKKIGTVERLQIGQSLPFAREQVSAINKYMVDEVEVTTLGFVGDEQADQFFHGGQLRAVHQMPKNVYFLIKEKFPKLTLYEGLLGENLIIANMDETNVCIGDIYQIGSVQLQVTRPRRPCWKIDSQLNMRGVAKYLLDCGCAGWYYRVLQTGQIKQGDTCNLLNRVDVIAPN